MRVLVIEDYAPVRTAVCQALQEAGFSVDVAADGADGQWFADSNEYDVIVLDLGLPGKDGLSILASIRDKENPANVLILTARDRVEDRIEGLNLGADDYLTKPFDLGEVVARVQALVRRKYNKLDTVIRVGDLEIDTVRREARRADREVALTAREYALLEYLALRSGELVTRADIWTHVYEFESTTTSNVVDVYIGYLRRKLEVEGTQKLIHTRRGQGFVLEVV